MIFNYRVKVALLLYLLFIMALIYLQPSFFYKKNGEFKEFGVGKNKTILPIWLVILVEVVIC